MLKVSRILMATHQSVGVNPFFLKSAKIQFFPSHYSQEWLVEQVEAALAANKFKQGYREGVILVEIPAAGFKTRVVSLQDGQPLTGHFKSRVPGETPRKGHGVTVKSPNELPDGAEVEVVLYARETLAEKDEERTGADWDIITVLVHPSKGGAPMSPETLMANHFGADGGSNTKMRPEEFQESLRASHDYWKDKALADLEDDP